MQKREWFLQVPLAGRLGRSWFRSWLTTAVLFLSAWATTALAGAPPTLPGPIHITQVTAHAVWITWGASTDPDNDHVAYQVALRKRLEGVAQAWGPAQDTAETSTAMDGLAANTVYDVRVRASDGHLFSEWRPLELAFRTLAEANHPPGLPGAITVTEITASSARIAWGAASDPDGDAVGYQVSLRQRLEGVAREWLPAKTTSATALVWEGLSPETLYEVRVRATDGKDFSAWLIREHAFKTLTPGDAPGRPGEITVGEVTATAVHLAWTLAAAPAGVQLVYELQLRKRLEGIPQAWQPARETTATAVGVDGLTPDTTYDARVRAWNHAVAGDWTIKENAFHTLPSGHVNLAPTQPGPITVTHISPHSARLGWVASTDADGDPVAYLVSVRRRVEAVPQDWLPAQTTHATALVWDGLAAKALYDVRVQATDGKASSAWRVSENAFRTLPLGGLIGFVAPGVPGQGVPPQTVTLAWPVATTGAPALEAADDLMSPAWSPLGGEIETDGAVNRLVIPANAPRKFFRVR